MKVIANIRLWARMHYGPTAPVAVAEEETKDDDA